uniref:A-kinase interacting protein 1 n=1 Tax=Seriola lalandi dorsalis TaxID=1841481 RepID=A0A3B4XGK3_SERLL
MASQAWLESSLRRSASLGLEVLERASRRSVDWTSTGASQTPATTDENTQRVHRELNDAFATIAEFMAQTTYHCKRFYESGCCTELTENERNHKLYGASTSVLPCKSCDGGCGRVSAADEDFYIEVSPGTYAVTASMQESQQQTQLVSVKAGESMKLTFNL